MAENESFESSIKKIYLWMVVGGVALGSVGGTGLLRINKFTQSDSHLMRAEIITECKAYTDEVMLKENTTRPPIWTRARIIRMEQFVHSVHPEFEPASGEWR